MSKRVIFIDALNMLYRAYIVDPSLSTNGQPIGGIKGFLKMSQKLIREMKPDSVVVAWDGEGGSRRRRQIKKDYKAGRKPIRLNRQIRNLTESEEVENKIWQQTRLTEYLNHLPIAQVMLPSVEADDVIGYCVQMEKYKGWQKIIVSSDKDFIQLCDEETVLYRPIQKVFLNSKRVLEEYGIHPVNFALARALSGDKSDNLPGVPGVGMKTVAKRFPFFADEKVCDINFLLDYCKERQDEKLKVYTSIIENIDLVRDNYKLMQLYAPSIHIQGKQTVRSAVEDFEYEFNKTGIVCMMNEDGFGAYDWSDLFTASKRMVRGKGSLYKDIDLWADIPLLTKIASAFFVLGKVVGFMTFFTFFVDITLAKWMLMLYATFIGISILLSTCQLFKTDKTKKPTREEVIRLAREYNLLEGK